MSECMGKQVQYSSANHSKYTIGSNKIRMKFKNADDCDDYLAR